MNRVWKWILIFLGALIVVFLVSSAFILTGFSRIGRLGYLGMMRGGYGMFGYGMGFGFLAWLVGLVVLVFAIIGVISLFRHDQGHVPPAPPRACPNCGRTVDSSWVSCPYCGQDLRTPPPAQNPPAEQKPQ